MDFPIDFIVTWVDGNDTQWQKKKSQYNTNETKMNGASRYRDYEIFKYWFRAIENNAPWVHRIFLVTDNQVPSWLKNNEKIELVDHSEYIDAKYLPTFNSNVIEMNFANIPGLSEHFVVFNDDTFMVNPMQPTDFFDENGVPVDCFVSNVIQPTDDFSHIFVQNLKLINQKYNKREVISKNKSKYFNFKYGKLLLLNFYLLPFGAFTRFYDPHLPMPYTKTNLQTMWRYFGEDLEPFLSNRFRKSTDFSIWLARYIRLVEGDFVPTKIKGRGSYFQISDVNQVREKLQTRDFFVVVNDDDNLTNAEFENIKPVIKKTFEEKWPQKSEFEK
ncbi:Stealth CR1 domain-containing protein [Weissella viridescens]|uniref:Stealth CR1 domain-containing protein n=1 Tax=Weissella viridescens TaxID=1629 RepID=UPI0017468DBC|nr:Stealth CR1 domain-containing protein [Weissella viridescens]QOD85854.1 Stealth CR1 domain-containing protein [Weissella viridescens]WJI90972.1 Stealth CR1 domain-containing protein [Weissella viridescens]